MMMMIENRPALDIKLISGYTIMLNLNTLSLLHTMFDRCLKIDTVSMLLFECIQCNTLVSIHHTKVRFLYGFLPICDKCLKQNK